MYARAVRARARGGGVQYDGLLDFAVPEIKRVPLENIALQVLP